MFIDVHLVSKIGDEKMQLYQRVASLPSQVATGRTQWELPSEGAVDFTQYVDVIGIYQLNMICKQIVPLRSQFHDFREKSPLICVFFH